MNRTHSWLVFATAFLIAVLPAPKVNADHTWGNYHWARNTNAFTLKVTASVTPDWSQELASTLTAWTIDGLLTHMFLMGGCVWQV